MNSMPKAIPLLHLFTLRCHSKRSPPQRFHDGRLHGRGAVEIRHHRRCWAGYPNVVREQAAGWRGVGCDGQDGEILGMRQEKLIGINGGVKKVKNSSNAARSCAFGACGSCAWVFGFLSYFCNDQNSRTSDIISASAILRCWGRPALVRTYWPVWPSFWAQVACSDWQLSLCIWRYLKMSNYLKAEVYSKCFHPSLSGQLLEKQACLGHLLLHQWLWKGGNGFKIYAGCAFCKACRRGSYRLLSIEYRLSGNVEKLPAEVTDSSWFPMIVLMIRFGKACHTMKVLSLLFLSSSLLLLSLLSWLLMLYLYLYCFQNTCIVRGTFHLPCLDLGGSGFLKFGALESLEVRTGRWMKVIQGCTNRFTFQWFARCCNLSITQCNASSSHVFEGVNL